MAAPMPREPPVMRAVRPARERVGAECMNLTVKEVVGVCKGGDVMALAGWISG